MIEIDEKAVVVILARTPPGEACAGWIASQIGAILRLHGELATLRNARRREVERHKAALKVIDSGVAEIRARCPHYSRRYCPDPSGGSDSFHVCDHCGHQW